MPQKGRTTSDEVLFREGPGVRGMSIKTSRAAYFERARLIDI